MKSFYLSLILVFSCSIIFAQKSLNSYKYILVPRQYTFLKSPDRYQVNSLTKFLFDKAGFTTLYDDEIVPDDLARNRCLAVKAMVEDNSGLFSTKLKIELLDCRNTVVYKTKEGRSKEKEYRKAYHEALRRAFAELEELNYTYEVPVNDAIEKVVVSEDKTAIKEPAIPIKEAIVNSESTEKVISPVVVVDIKSVKEKEIDPIGTKKADKEKEDNVEPVVLKEKVVMENQGVLQKTTLEKSLNYALMGTYIMDKWGICTISQKENNFTVVGGDENFEFATIFKTSKPTIYIIKWAAYKQPQLLEIDTDGNLKIDTDSGIRIYKRIN